MSALQPNPRPPPPGDEDLQHLYDEVWRIFGDESASPTERAPLRAASANSREHHPNTFRAKPDPASPPVSTARNSPPRVPRTYHPFCLGTHCLTTTLSEQPPHSPKIRSNIESAVSPTSQRPLRPLPLPPGAVLQQVSSPIDPHVTEVPPAVPNNSHPGTVTVDGYVNSKPFSVTLTLPPLVVVNYPKHLACNPLALWVVGARQDLQPLRLLQNQS